MRRSRSAASLENRRPRRWDRDSPLSEVLVHRPVRRAESGPLKRARSAPIAGGSLRFPTGRLTDPQNVHPKLTGKQPSQKHHKSYARPSTGAVSVTFRSIPRANVNQVAGVLAAQSAQKDHAWTTAPHAVGPSTGPWCVPGAVHTPRTSRRLPRTSMTRLRGPQRRGRHGARRSSLPRSPTPALVSPIPHCSVLRCPRTRWRT